jgi:hypothetical protein
MESTEEICRTPLSFAAVAKLLEGNRSVHVLHGAAVKDYFQALFRQTIAQLDVFKDGSQLVPENSVLSKKRSLAR